MTEKEKRRREGRRERSEVIIMLNWGTCHPFLFRLVISRPADLSCPQDSLDRKSTWGPIRFNNLPSYALQSRNDAAVGAHCGRTDQGPEMDPRRRSRLVERTAVGEGG